MAGLCPITEANLGDGIFPADAFVAQYAEETLPDGRQRVVRHGYGPERSILTGIGALDVQRPKVRDRAPDVPAEKKIRFSSAILPKWARRSRSLDALLPVLYLRGISMGNFQEALAAILHRFAYLKPALAALLIFIGGKVIVAEMLGL